MSTIGTFDGFTAARLGIYAAQQGLQVTGNNISNINTVGYTRQRLDQVSLKTGGADMYRSMLDNHIGNGALVTNISQIRDPYLDIRYRNTASEVGYTNTMLGGLQSIASILDEVGKGEEDDGLLYAQLQDLKDCLSRLGSDPSKDNDILARQSADTLCSLFNTYANKLETLRQNTETSFNQDITSVNEILNNIRDLNESIRNAEICGDNALELRDERNRQIDSLSEYMRIKVEYTMEDVGAGKQVEKLTISLGGANPDSLVETDDTVLVDGVYGAQIDRPDTKPMTTYVDADGNIQSAADQGFLYWKKATDDDGNELLDPDGNPRYEGTNKLSEAEQVANDNYTLVVSKLYDSKHHQPKDTTINEGHPVALDDNDLYGSLQATRELLTEKGEFATANDVALDENATSKRGILYYQMSLDLLAQKFAEQYNALNQNYIFNQAGNYVDENGNELMLEGKPISAKEGLTSEQADFLLDDPTQKYIQRDIHGNPVLDSDGNTIADINSWLAENGGVLAEGSGVLFSNRNDGDNTDDPIINASNISISHSWSTGDVKIVTTCEVLFSEDGTVLPNTTQVENVNHMISRIEQSLVYDPKDLDPDAVGSKLFEGCFNDMFSNMSTVQGNDARTVNIQLNTSYTILTDVDSSRMGVSGVDLNDEAMNMITYQKAYSAACRLMTVIDSVLDRLINNTGTTV